MKTIQLLYTSRFPEQAIQQMNESPYILNRLLSMNPELSELCSDLDKYSFNINAKIWYACALVNIQKVNAVPFFEYIKKQEEQEDEFKFLLDKVQKYYQIGSREMKMMLHILLKKWSDPDVLREYFEFFGVEKKYYKKYGLKFKSKKTKGIMDMI